MKGESRPPDRGKILSYTLYSVVSSILEQAAAVAIILWVLPQWGINIPLWGIIAILVIWVVCSYVFYRKGKAALLMKPITPPEDIIGKRGNAVEPLSPRGYVRISNELWKAVSTSAEVKVGEEIEVNEINGLTLLVSPLEKTGEARACNDNGKSPSS